MIWWLAFEKKLFQFGREIWIQVVVILLQQYKGFFYLIFALINKISHYFFRWGYQVMIWQNSSRFKRKAQGMFKKPVWALNKISAPYIIKQIIQMGCMKAQPSFRYFDTPQFNDWNNVQCRQSGKPKRWDD